MKLNGQNIITDKDVTITELGDSLASILKHHNNELSKLKSNVKWLYKYGGVGSGTGGGGNGSTSGNGKWYVMVEINGISFQCNANDTGSITTGNIVLSSPGQYNMTMTIIRPNGGTFSTTTNWNNGGGILSAKSSLTADNEWTINLSMYLGGNNTVSIRVTDNEYMAILNISYITTPYVFNLELSDADGSNPKKNGEDVFIANIGDSGLVAKLSYDIGVEIAEDDEGNKTGIKYTYTDILGNTIGPLVLDISQGTNGVLYLNICDDPEFLLDDNNSALYTFKLGLDIQTKAGGGTSHEDFTVSFNLIPSDLYLKIVPDNGTIYRQLQNDGTLYVYYTGAKSYAITPYYGFPLGRNVQVSIYVDGEIKQDSITVAERDTLIGQFTTVDIINLVEDDSIVEHTLLFKAVCGNEVKIFTYYLYAKNINGNLQWYPEVNSVLTPPNYQNYWRNNQLKTFELSDKVAFEMTASSTEKLINIEQVPQASADLLFSCGILYSEINTGDNPIISIYSVDSNGIISTSSQAYINIYYDKIVLNTSTAVAGGEKIDVYINKTPYEEYTLASKKYHLLTLYKRLLTVDEKNNVSYYEITFYIDGVLERTFQTWINIAPIYNKILLHPGNYYINLLELSYFNHTISIDTTTNTPTHVQYMSDANIVRYWYSYQALKLEVTDLDITTLAAFESSVKLLETDAYYNLPTVTSSGLTSIATNSDVPILKFSVDDRLGGRPFLEWFTDISYTENDIIPSKQVTVEYSAGHADVSKIETSGCYFTIDVQGSTTRQYRGKNLELSINKSSGDDATTYLFSPNFNSNDENTYLPEMSFTLKADAVDSSHSNNTTMGAFINDQTVPFADAEQSGHKYGKYVKNCLIGYACLVFIEVTPVDGSSPVIYYLGVYNFNLGRGSFFNLGYIDLDKLSNAICTDDTTGVRGLRDGFHIYTVNDMTKLPNFVTAEITGNDNRYDFSQYHESILFRSSNDNDVFAMFDDIETGMTTAGRTTSILEMVKSVAKAGHYIFKSIGKNFGSYSDGYAASIKTEIPYDEGEEIPIDPTTNEPVKKYSIMPINQVPDYTTQYIRTYTLDGNTFTPLSEHIPDGTNSDWNACINPNNTSGVVPKINYQSLVEYYTICMIFGLFDSVQKNLNVRTWNGQTYYLAFYDMDTCLGVDNAGNDSSYFAFSDYWYSTEKEIELGRNDTIIRPSTVSVYRDYCPLELHGFDIPSSYLFAIAKYSKIFETYYDREEGEEVDLEYPNRLWARWRRSEGPLCNAESFIDNYYKKHLDGVNELMLNYNYRSKYFVRGKDTTGAYLNAYDTTNFNKFKGRRLEYVRQWLDGRFHLLDAYFNMPKTINLISKYNLETNKWEEVQMPGGNVNMNEPILAAEDIDANNMDIYIIHSIFGDEQRFYGNIDLRVKASDYSPTFLIPTNGNVERKLLTDSTKKYQIYSEKIGSNAVNIGGSSMWTELDNINSFDGNFYISSILLTTLTGTSGTITNFTVDMPSVKTISLTSPNYSGNLTLDANTQAPNLQSVNLTNTAIAFSVNSKSSLKELIYSNGKGASINVVNCPNLTSILLSGSFGNISIDNVPISIKYTALKSTSIDMTALSGKHLTFELENDTTCTNITLRNFETITIHNCPKLQSVTISGSDAKSISIYNDSASLSSLTKVDANITNVTTLDLHNNFLLSELALTADNKVTTLNLKNTNVTKATWKKVVTTSIEGSNTGAIETTTPLTEYTNYLDLWYFTSITNFNIQNNVLVKAILFNNDSSTKFITFNNAFTGCTALERVYGNLKINAAECFNNLNKFSIHGSDLSKVTYNNKSVLSATKRIIPIYELLGDTKNAEPVKSTLYQSGRERTNITFATTNAASAYQYTACTLFDIYYTFYNPGAMTSASTIFQYTTWSDYNHFYWDETVNNCPNRYMFNKVPNLTSISCAFRLAKPSSAETPVIVLTSPTDTENGLYGPLTKVTDFSGIFYGYSYYHDQYLFSNIAKTNYAVTTINYLHTSLLLDNSNTLTSPPKVTGINETYIEKYGKIVHFFDYLTKLTTANGLFNGTYYIQYPDPSNEEDAAFMFPNTLTTMRNSFISSYAKGILYFSDYWSSTGAASIRDIRGSFRVNNKVAGIAEPELIIDENMFNKTPKLAYIGYIDSKDLVFNTKDTIGDFGSSRTSASFNGGGLKKTLRENQWPSAIVSKLPELISFSCLFAGIEYQLTDLELPGDMFQKNSKLVSPKAAFFNLWASYKLTPNSFANCPNLGNVEYMFAREVDGTHVRTNYTITSTIPYQLFYHGKQLDSTKIIRGCMASEVKNVIDPSTGEETSEKIFPDTATSLQVTYPVYNANITYMNNCFMNQQFNSYNEAVTKNDVERNPNYNPFDYTYNGQNWIENKNKCTLPYTFIWKYNGLEDIDDIFNKTLNDDTTVSYKKEDFEMPEHMVADMVVSKCKSFTWENHNTTTDNVFDLRESTLQFFCPPDLFRYCKVNCSIDGIFYACGKTGYGPYSGIEETNIRAWGLQGRICPYLLRPLSNITSITNFLTYCRGIVGYKVNNQTYYIPPSFFTYATGITNLSYAFKYNIIPDDVDMSLIFKPLTNSLNVLEIFYGTVFPTAVNSVFLNNNVSNCRLAFAVNTGINTVPTTLPYKQTVTFSQVFKNYTNYVGNSNFQYVFNGYYVNNVTHESHATLSTVTTDYNYNTWS